MIDADKFTTPEEAAQAIARVYQTVAHVRATPQDLMPWSERFQVELLKLLGGGDDLNDPGFVAVREIASVVHIIDDANSVEFATGQRIADSNEEGMKLMREREIRHAALEAKREVREEQLDSYMVKHQANWTRFLDARLPVGDSHIEAGVILRSGSDAGFGVVTRDDSGLLKLTIAVTDQRTKQQMIQHRYFDVSDVQTMGFLERVPEQSRIIGS